MRNEWDQAPLQHSHVKLVHTVWYVQVKSLFPKWEPQDAGRTEGLHTVRFDFGMRGIWGDLRISGSLRLVLPASKTNTETLGSSVSLDATTKPAVWWVWRHEFQNIDFTSQDLRTPPPVKVEWVKMNKRAHIYGRTYHRWYNQMSYLLLDQELQSFRVLKGSSSTKRACSERSLTTEPGRAGKLMEVRTRPSIYILAGTLAMIDHGKKVPLLNAPFSADEKRKFRCCWTNPPPRVAYSVDCDHDKPANSPHHPARHSKPVWTSSIAQSMHRSRAVSILTCSDGGRKEKRVKEEHMNHSNRTFTWEDCDSYQRCRQTWTDDNLHKFAA